MRVAAEIGCADLGVAGATLCAVLDALREQHAAQTARLTRLLAEIRVAGGRAVPDVALDREVTLSDEFLAQVARRLPRAIPPSDARRVVSATLAMVARDLPEVGPWPPPCA